MKPPDPSATKNQNSTSRAVAMNAPTNQRKGPRCDAGGVHGVLAGFTTGWMPTAWTRSSRSPSRTATVRRSGFGEVPTGTGDIQPPPPAEVDGVVEVVRLVRVDGEVREPRVVGARDAADLRRETVAFGTRQAGVVAPQPVDRQRHEHHVDAEVMGDVEEELEVAVLAGRRVGDVRLVALELREVRKDPLRVVAVVEAVRVGDPALPMAEAFACSLTQSTPAIACLPGCHAPVYATAL